MGYQYYLCVIDKDKLEKIKQVTKPREEDESIEYCKMDLIEENSSFTFELGKLGCIDNNDITEVIYRGSKNIINDCDYEAFVANQKSFFELANLFLKATHKYYDSLLSFADPKRFKVSRKAEGYMKKDTAISEIIRDCSYRCNVLRTAEFKEYEGDIDIDWFYDYEAFNLIYLHRKIDFDKQVVVCIAY